MQARMAMTLIMVLAALQQIAAQDEVRAPYFGIRVVDLRTGRGVPLIELKTVNGIALVTDSAGWIAFHEPGLMDRQVHFIVSGPGYEHAKDGFGIRGVRLMTRPGTAATVKVERLNIAERLYRVTGQGIYRDTTLLGLKAPRAEPNVDTSVLGQDSVQAVRYRGKIFWLWGDTSVAGYPLGNFQTTAAWSALPGKDGDNPSAGIALHYFTDTKRVDGLRRMAPFKEPGVVWLFGLLTVTDDHGEEALVAHFTRRKSLAEEVEHGIVRFDDRDGVFKKIVTLDRKDNWHFPRGNAVRVSHADGEYFYFAAPFCHTRVKATWAALLDPSRYEALAVDESGKYVWQRGSAARGPRTQADEEKLLRDGKLKANEARYALRDALSDKPVAVHGASIAWNEFRKKWLLIGVQRGDKDAPSFLGEVWYAEADAIDGPWRKAIKVATHPNYSFYNPRHHAFFDENAGRTIYFEGTYTHTFSGNPIPIPRYDYNQMMYRLDLDDERLKAVR
jgi:hypothetical protein